MRERVSERETETDRQTDRQRQTYIQTDTNRHREKKEREIVSLISFTAIFSDKS